MGVTVRTATPAGKVTCLRLLGQLAEATGGDIDPQAGDVFDGLVAGARGQILVAVEDQDIFGLAAVSYNLAMRYGGEYCQLEELVVDPAARAGNVGTFSRVPTQPSARASASQRACHTAPVDFVAPLGKVPTLPAERALPQTPYDTLNT